MPSESCASKCDGSSARTAFSFRIALSKSPALKSNIASSYCSCRFMRLRCNTLTHASRRAQASVVRVACSVRYQVGSWRACLLVAIPNARRRKMSSPIKLISTDFDGTLFAEFENPPIPEHLQKLIGNLQSQGVLWVINTGRDMSGLMEALARAQISVKPDYLVLVEREIHCHKESQYVGL